MATYNFTLRNQYKPGTESKQTEIKKVTDAKKKSQLLESILSMEQVPIRLTVGVDRTHRFHVNTAFVVYPKQWSFTEKKMKSMAAGSQDFNKKLDELRESVRKYYDELMELEEKPTFEQVRDLVNEFVATKRKPKFSENEMSFFDVYDEFLERKANELHHRTIQKFNTSRKKLEAFTDKYYPRYFNFEKIDVNFIDKYKTYLQYEAFNQKATHVKKKEKRTGMRNDTTAKYIENLKNFLRWSHERGFHTNMIFQHSQFKAPRQTNLDIVTLSIHELKTLYEKDLSEDISLERVRDVFCFGAFTGQRWSDVTSFSSEDLNGDTWIFESYKTKKKITIPLVGYASPALDILKKYNYQLPSISNQKFNDYIKLAAGKAELNRTVEIKRYQGNKTITLTKPLHEVISSHMARRTAVSILLNVYRIPVSQVMEITGHSDFKTLKRYINKDSDVLRKNMEDTRSVTELLKVIKPDTKTA